MFRKVFCQLDLSMAAYQDESYLFYKFLENLKAKLFLYQQQFLLPKSLNHFNKQTKLRINPLLFIDFLMSIYVEGKEAPSVKTYFKIRRAINRAKLGLRHVGDSAKY